LNCIAKAFTIYEADDLCKMRRHMHDQKWDMLVEKYR
jgi:hypothetical protein